MPRHHVRTAADLIRLLAARHDPDDPEQGFRPTARRAGVNVQTAFDILTGSAASRRHSAVNNLLAVAEAAGLRIVAEEGPHA